MRTLVLSILATSLVACEGVSVNVAADKPEDEEAAENERVADSDVTTTTVAEITTTTIAPPLKKVFDAAGAEIGLLSEDGKSIVLTAELTRAGATEQVFALQQVASLDSLEEGFARLPGDLTRCVWADSTCGSENCFLPSDQVDIVDATTLLVPYKHVTTAGFSGGTGYIRKDGQCVFDDRNRPKKAAPAYELVITLPLRVEETP